MSFTLTSSGAIIMKSGINASSTATSSGAMLKEFCDEAEGYLCADTQYDWVENYSSIGTNFKPILSLAVSNLASMYIIDADLSVYTSRAEGQTMLNVNYDNYTKAVDILKNAEVRKKMGAS